MTKITKNQWLKKYYEISKRSSRKKPVSKAEALAKIYEVKGNRHKERFQGTIKLPICLMGCKLRLIEVKE